MPLPWATNSQMPWDVGRTFVDDQGIAWTWYQDPASPSGYTLKRQDANGVSFQTGPTPNDPYAGAAAFQASPYGQTLQRGEEALAAQNAWNRNFQTTGQQNTHAYQMGQLGVSQAAQQSTAEYQRGLLENARAALEVQKTGQQLNTGYQALQLGSQLRGPRDLWAYDRTAGAAGSNPLIANAVSTWANMASNRPTGGGAWNGGNPERMTVGALAQDFGGMNAGLNATTDPMGISSTTAGSGKQQTLMALDEVARNPHKVAPGWWESKSGTQQQMALGAFEELGHDPDTVMSRLNAGRLRQGIGSSRAA